MDLRTRTQLFCAALALAIATSVLLGGRVRQLQILFAAFAADVGLWYLTQGLFLRYRTSLWERSTELAAVLMPQLAIRLFAVIVPREPEPILTGDSPPQTAAPPRRSRLIQIASMLAVPMAALVLSPYHEHDAARVALFVYVGGLIVVALWSLFNEGSASTSRAVRARTRFLAVVGALAIAFSLADFLYWIGARGLPPVGAVLSIVFLFVLAQSLQSARLLDLYDLAGRLLVATALAFCLAGIFWMFVSWVGRFQTMYLNAVLASIAILVVFNPLQNKVEEKIHQIFFRERFDLESAVGDLRKRLAHVLETREMTTIVMAGLERSRRITAAALYLREGASEPGGAAYILEGHVGETPAAVRVEEASGRALLDRLHSKGTVVAEEVERELTDALDQGDAHAAVHARDLYTRLDSIGGGVAFPVKDDDGELVGVLVVDDDRVRDAFTPEELSLLEGLAAQLASVIENSRAYARVKERDRLAALGAMAAGLAHEVKNPLGAIKGAAQLLAETQAPKSPTAGNGHAEGDQEFVGIILEEVERLDRVVSSILDYARPRTIEVEPIDINGAVRRTMQILAPSHDEQVQVAIELAADLPEAKIDPEQLRQVLMNLVTNAVQAMGGRGRLTVVTGYRRTGRAIWPVTFEHGVVEIRVADTGPGISGKVLKNLFVPFFSTKSKGTGLGLAISQRIVQNAGGAIDVQTTSGVGTTFTILLPATKVPDRASSPASEPMTPASSRRESKSA